MLSVGAFVEGELYLSWMHFFQAHSCLYSFSCFILLFVFLLLFLFIQGITRGHCLGMVTRADMLPTSTFTEMRRLARDETPFPLAMQPKVTALAW
jgi:hypothetical protein